MEFIGITCRKNFFTKTLLNPLKLIVAGVGLCGLSAAVSAAPPTCSATIVNQWGGGSQVSLTVSNPNGSAMSDWHVEVSYTGGQVANSWNAVMVGSNPAQFTAPAWQPNIAPNSSYTFGFVAQYSGGLQQPVISACYQGSIAIADADADGIADDVDTCPNTPPNATVNANGCASSQLDADNDGISNNLDSCANTPSNEVANNNGCSPSQLDADSDGVSDALDSCANTPIGTLVDSTGCPTDQGGDSDGDGVDDALDVCPNTPIGSMVDLQGCALISDLKVEAENYVAATDTTTGNQGSVSNCAYKGMNVDVSDTSDAGGGCNVGWIASGEVLEYDINLSSGAYRLSSRVASTMTQGKFNLYLDNVLIANDSIPNTGGWSNYQTHDLGEVSVTGGSHRLRVTITGSYFNLNWINFEFIPPLDSDNDGVNDALDTCPSTPAGSSVNASGCAQTQLDSDNDGVNDALDTCPSTPTGSSVNASGCALSQLDSDNDGVNDALDTCPATPAGSTVNASGCAQAQLDSDNDGVNDALDTCPATPAGSSVNASGCAQTQLDSDNDGVNDALDTCPSTPTGSSVNASGCAQAQLDSDNDGVNDALDTCPATPTGSTVNASGCAQTQLDSDSDGVNDALDTCPATPAGSTVNASGCAQTQLDSDNDGVNDALDTCPATPAGSSVNASGCAQTQLDSDSDGVNDALDTCPATPLGEPVDAVGCSLSELDADNDGVSDDVDLCPASSMSVTIYGCDTFGDEDQDTIPNDVDLCPFSLGLAELRGCKSDFGDFDRDGVSDDIDECPYSTALDAIFPFADQVRTPLELRVEANGCSLSETGRDFDGDSVFDDVDRCTLLGVLQPSSPNLGADGCTELQNQDEDGDGIILGLDLCPHQFGLISQNGCGLNIPFDIDNDGIRNDIDQCPLSTQVSIGNIGPNGCSHEIGTEDFDGDGVRNEQDVCRASPLGHKVNSSGCTLIQQREQEDNDEDGVINQWDQCPDTFVSSGAGQIIELTSFGCLVFNVEDQDRDGLPDTIDLCPNESGLYLNNGCPTDLTAFIPSGGGSDFVGFIEDKDADGVPDSVDNCPFTLALNANPMMIAEPNLEGCAVVDLLDGDGDGVRNGNDRCPRTVDASFLDEQGCSDFERLDNDGDELMNGEDLCPNIYGLWKLNGCATNILDSDQDGVENKRDLCPRTPGKEFGPFMAVNIDTGCAEDINAEDSDGDGIENGLDNCANTPLGELVGGGQGNFNEMGCGFSQLNPELDQDNDGVPDFRDQCFDTPQGQPVNFVGCFEPSSDNDKDNVPNGSDQCNDSPFRSAVDFDGCSADLSPLLNGPLRLEQIALPSPENPNQPQEHEVNLLSLLQMPADGPSNSFPQIEFGQVDSNIADVFNAGPPGVLFIHVRPEFRGSTVHIPVRLFVPELDKFTNWSEIIIRPSRFGGGTVALSSLVINDPLVLSNTGIQLRDLFKIFSRQTEFEGVQLFKQFWDSQRSLPAGNNPFFCTGEMNGFPIVCDRIETNVAFMSDVQAGQEMDLYRLTAVVNRIDLRKGVWEDCGEHRLVFAIQNDPRGRKFLSFEARLPNPTPGDVHGCDRIINFWDEMATTPDGAKGLRIRDFFLENIETGLVGMATEHFFEGAGQIRSNQFMGGEWLLKEHKLVDFCSGPSCDVLAKTVSVKQNPFGELFNPDLPFTGSPMAQAAAEFQDDFIANMDTLTGSTFGSLNIATEDRFNHGQSHASGFESQENDYRLHFGGRFSSQFGDDLFFALQGKNNADGTPLQADQVLARAVGLTCGGCHNPDQFGITQPGSIGRLALPDGRIIDAWPRSNGFVHIDESGQLSQALQEVFLPIRQTDFAQILSEL